MQQHQPNILLICVDQMRAGHMGCAGHPLVQTPNLDRLASLGTVFNRSYCNNPICMPARTSMFTGLLPRDHGVRFNGQYPHANLPCLPQVLNAVGYRTHAAGKLHLTPYVPKLETPDASRFPEDMEAWNRGDFTEFPTPYFGFESVDFVGGHTSFVFGEYIQWLRDQGGDPAMLQPNLAREPACVASQCYRMALPVEMHYNRYIADSTAAFIDAAAGNPDHPFFAYCSIPDPHYPVAPPAPYDTMYDPADIPLPPRNSGESDNLPPIYQRVFNGDIHPNGTNNANLTDTKTREMIALTLGMVSHLDAELGRVFDALERNNLWNNTVVLFVSDHGDMMGDHGLLWKSFYTFEGCVRIPTIVAAPGMPGGRKSESLISQIDLMPSLLDFAGVTMPGSEWEEATTPFERGSVQPIPLYGGRSWRPLLSDDQATIRDSVVIENDDPGTGLRPRCLVTTRYRITTYAGQPWGELFDRQTDPDELHNLWDEPAHQSLRAELLRQLLDQYTAQTPWRPIPPWNS
ncbi:sulfatase family protein [Puniceicoccus vermicola]|uniref:Sulfatase-like hydrolase/transferase n=1 Tax=Puniceicoccus vermicola TaxID=388746 RepID=A0A7X1E715_9BACT|nr:sulfatase-like hydrolase/transferase [Puniceicoccus vermicola]MBC2603232.1 sulfatase-like hydrolase/transferase [Puniceicoccus vermicola]